MEKIYEAIAEKMGVPAKEGKCSDNGYSTLKFKKEFKGVEVDIFTKASDETVEDDNVNLIEIDAKKGWCAQESVPKKWEKKIEDIAKKYNEKVETGLCNQNGYPVKKATKKIDGVEVEFWEKKGESAKPKYFTLYEVDQKKGFCVEDYVTKEDEQKEIDLLKKKGVVAKEGNCKSVGYAHYQGKKEIEGVWYVWYSNKKEVDDLKKVTLYELDPKGAYCA